MKSKQGVGILIAAAMCASVLQHGAVKGFHPGGAEEECSFVLRLPGELEESRGKMESQIAQALAAVVAWFAEQGFAVQPRDVIDTAIVFATKAQAKAELARRFQVDDAQLPDGFSGTVDGRTLLLVSEEIFARIFQTLYPNETWGGDTYRQLITHELAHRVHAILASAMYGSEDGMGPRWFFEGLAIHCAGQFVAAKGSLRFREIKSLIDQDARAPLSYPDYGRLFSALAKNFTIRELIEHAGKEDFLAFLEERCPN